MNPIRRRTKLRRFLIGFGLFCVALIVIVVIMNLLTIFFFSYKRDPNYQGPRPRPAELLEYYDYPKHFIDAKIDIMGETDNYIHKRVRFLLVTRTQVNLPADIYAKEYDIYLDYFENKAEGKFPTIILFPTFGGGDVGLEARLLADYFVPEGFNCAIFRGEEIDYDSLMSVDYVEGFLKRAVLDIRQQLDFLQQQDKVDGERMGCVGLSLGGIEAVVAAGVDERLKCNVIALAGGSMADIICYSKEPRIKGAREKAIKKQNETLEEIHNNFEINLKTDPIKLAPYVDARNVLMMEAYFDNRVIPRKYSDKLRDAMGRPEMFYMFTEHFKTPFLYLPYARWRALHFFKDKFEMGE